MILGGGPVKEIFVQKKKIIVIALVMATGILIPVFSQNLLEDLQDNTHKFADNAATSLSFNSLMGLNWSDAYIGQLFGVPPHFGIGVSGGLTTMDYGVVEKLLGNFSASMPFSLNRMILPGYTVEARIGGLILPFDTGVKVGFLPGLNLGEGVKFDYTLIGGDIRYALLRGKAGLPKVSLGFGINHLSGGIRSSVGKQRFTFGTSPSHTLALEDSKVNLFWTTTTYDFKIQISQSLLIVTPYLGLGTSFSRSRAGYQVDSRLSYDGAPVGDGSQMREDLKKAGISGIDFDGAEGFSSSHTISGWGLRIFGGFSLNLAVLKLDFTGMYRFFDSAYGGSFGVRLQI